MKWALGTITIILAIFVFSAIMPMFFSPENAMRTRVARASSAAISAKDPSRCASLPKILEHQRSPDDEKGGGPYITYPADECLSSYYRAVPDPSVCDRLHQLASASGCFEYMAKTLSDASFCDRMTNQRKNSSNACRAAATGDINECDAYKASAYVYAGCVTSVVLRTHNKDQCLLLLPNTDEYGVQSRFNDCLRIVGKVKPEEQQELCTLMQYPEWTLPEKKAQCIAENWPSAQ